MSIVHTSIEFTTQADGSYSVVEWHTDHLGQKYNRVYFADAGSDLNERASIYAAQLEIDLANAEIDQIIGEFN